MKALNLNFYRMFLIILIIIPLSTISISTFSEDRASAGNMININKEYSGELEEMKIKLELLKRDIETKLNKRDIQSISHTSDTSQKIYTIQTGSFLTLDRAQNEFDSIMKKLKTKYCSFLRVEKVKRFYTVRLGKFESYNSAENFISSVSPYIPKAIILKTNLIFDKLRSCICY